MALQEHSFEDRALATAAHLEHHRRRVDLSQDVLAERFRARYGEPSRQTIQNWFRGYYWHGKGPERVRRPVEPTVSQFNGLVEVINERASELGLEPAMESIDLALAPKAIPDDRRRSSGGSAPRFSRPDGPETLGTIIDFPTRAVG